MSDIRFWKPVYQLFKPDEPLSKPEDLRDFYVPRDGNPVRSLVSSLELSDVPEKFLLAGHRGGGKTTELRKLQQRFEVDYTVIWVDADTALARYVATSHEVVVLIGLNIFETLVQTGWNIPTKVKQELLEILKKVVYQEEEYEKSEIELPEFFQNAKLALSIGLQAGITKGLDIRPALAEIITKVNAVIKAAETGNQKKLLVIVDGLDRREQGTAQEMFSNPLLTALDCHIIYSIPMSLRYSPAFKQSLESFDKCLDLANPPVFECDERSRPTVRPDKEGRDVLKHIIRRRLDKLGTVSESIFQPDALELLCEKSGGVIRDLIRLSRTTCEVALEKKTSTINLEIAQMAVLEERKNYTIRDYHFPVLAKVHKTGQLTSDSYDSPKQGKIVICDELLQYKFILGYEDHRHRVWFDANPILLEVLERQQIMGAMNDLEECIDKTVLNGLNELAKIYENHLERKDYAKLAETANLAYEMCQKIADSLEQNTDAYRKVAALSAYWKLSRDLYRGQGV